MPSWSARIEDHCVTTAIPRSERWAKAICEIVDAFSPERRHLLNVLCRPHRPRKELLDGAAAAAEVREYCAKELAREDAQLLLEANRLRPWMILQFRIQQQGLPEPCGAE